MNNGILFNITGGSAAADLIISGSITQSGAVTLAGNGVMALSGANTYQGATIINGGTLELGAGGTTGSLYSAGTITDNGALAFNRSTTVAEGADFSSSGISGSGSVSQIGSGMLVLNAANSYSGGTTVSNGTLQLGPLGSIAASSGVNVNGGALDVTARFANAHVAARSARRAR